MHIRSVRTNLCVGAVMQKMIEDFERLRDVLGRELLLLAAQPQRACQSPDGVVDRRPAVLRVRQKAEKIRTTTLN